VKLIEDGKMGRWGKRLRDVLIPATVVTAVWVGFDWIFHPRWMLSTVAIYAAIVLVTAIVNGYLSGEFRWRDKGDPEPQVKTPADELDS
jgi:hypothetical protein